MRVYICNVTEYGSSVHIQIVYCRSFNMVPESRRSWRATVAVASCVEELDPAVRRDIRLGGPLREGPDARRGCREEAKGGAQRGAGRRQGGGDRPQEEEGAARQEEASDVQKVKVRLQSSEGVRSATRSREDNHLELSEERVGCLSCTYCSCELSINGGLSAS